MPIRRSALCWLLATAIGGGSYGLAQEQVHEPASTAEQTDESPADESPQVDSAADDSTADDSSAEDAPAEGATTEPDRQRPTASAAKVAEVFGKMLAVTFGDAPPEIMAEDFGDDDEDDEFSALIGSPAPEFTAEDLDGEQVTLDDLKGKVVVLDFWATWCGPCMRAMPQINKLANDVDAERVVVLGVNQADDPADIDEALEDHDDTLRHLLDPDDEIGSAFGCSSIPMTVVIDSAGVVQAVHSGYDSQLGATLKSEVDRLLAGENIFDEDLVRIRREERQQQADENRKKIGPVNEERLEKAGSIELGDSAYFDGPGANGWARVGDKPVLALSVGGNSITLLESADAPPEVIELKWKDDGVDGVNALRLVETDEGLQLVAAASTYNDDYDAESFIVGLFDRDGESVWQVETPVVGEWGDQTVAVGDLDGDGSPEVVQLSEHYGMTDATRPEEYVHVLAVYSRTGELLARTWFDGADGVGVYLLPSDEGARILVNRDGAGVVYRFHPPSD